VDGEVIVLLTYRSPSTASAFISVDLNQDINNSLAQHGALQQHAASCSSSNKPRTSTAATAHPPRRDGQRSLGLSK
jgi:hypothetical protein